MSMQALSKAMTDDLYAAGRNYRDENNHKCQPLQYLGAYAKDEGIFPEEKELGRLTDRLIARLKVPEWAETKRKQCKELTAQKWVLDKYFADRKVKMWGEHADSMEKAFQVSPAELTVFPFFWDTIIIESILAVPLLDIMVADTVSVNSGTAVHAVMNETVLDRSIGVTGEFASFQEVNVTSTESTVRLLKFGGQVTVSDEAMRRQRIPVFARGFSRYGRQIGIDMTDLGIDILLNGDGAYGGGGGAIPTVACAAPGSPNYGDYLRAMFKFPIGYEPTDNVMSQSGFIKLLNQPEFKDPLAGFKFQSTAILPEKFGLMPHRWDSTKSTTWSPTGVLGDSTTELYLQRGRALIMYQEGGLSTESDRDPRSQSTVLVTSWYLMFAIADRLAAVALTGVA